MLQENLLIQIIKVEARIIFHSLRDSRRRFIEQGKIIRNSWSYRNAAPVNAPLLGNCCEKLALAGDTVGLAQEQIASGAQREGKERNDAPLYNRLDVNQDVSTTDKIEFRKRRFAD